MDKDKETEEIRDLTPEKDAKGGVPSKAFGERPKKQPAFEPVPISPPADTDPYSKT